MRSRWTILRVSFLLFASAAAGACTSGRARPRIWSAPASGYSVTVRNDNWLDADVYATYLGSNFRLGFVRGLTTATLPLPRDFIHLGTVQLRVDPVGTESTYTSDQIVISPGQRIELTVNTVLSMSNYAVWNR